MPWEQLAILVIIGLISFVNWLMQKSAEHKAARRTQERIDRGEQAPEANDFGEPDEAERAYEAEEQRRRFMEALGMPVADAEPTPQARAQRDVVSEGPVTRGPARNFLHKLSGDLEQRLVPAETVQPPPIMAPTSRPTTAARRKRAARKVAAPLAPGAPLEFLRDREGLRKAILSQEVLGRCKGLSFDL